MTARTEGLSTSPAERRDVNLLDYKDINCSTDCWGNAGDGPNEYDCYKLIAGMWREGNNKFQISPGKHYSVVSNDPNNSCLITL